VLITGLPILSHRSTNIGPSFPSRSQPASQPASQPDSQPDNQPAHQPASPPACLHTSHACLRNKIYPFVRQQDLAHNLGKRSYTIVLHRSVEQKPNKEVSYVVPVVHRRHAGAATFTNNEVSVSVSDNVTLSANQNSLSNEGLSVRSRRVVFPKGCCEFREVEIERKRERERERERERAKLVKLIK